MKTENKKNLALYLVLIIISITFLGIASRASAATGDIQYVPLAPIEGTFDATTKTTNLGTYLAGIFKVGVAAAGALAFLMIVWGGFTYLSTDAITGKEEGKERITRALGGLILALAAYIILNTINPSLVNLNLYFGEPAKPAADINAPSEYQSLVDIQLAQLKAASERQDVARLAEVNRLKANAATLRANADALQDGPSKTALLAEADKITQQAEELNLQRVAAIQERLVSETTLNAYTPEKLAAAIADAGTSVQKIQAAYTEARTAFASNPARVADLTAEEMSRISVIRKATAFGIIENPPLNNPNDSRASVSDESGKVLSGYVNRDALNAQIDAQIAQILDEQKKQIANLTALNATPGVNLNIANVTAIKAQIDATANAQICQIKNACKNADYGCETLRPGVVCVY